MGKSLNIAFILSTNYKLTMDSFVKSTVCSTNTGTCVKTTNIYTNIYTFYNAISIVENEWTVLCWIDGGELCSSPTEFHCVCGVCVWTLSDLCLMAWFLPGLLAGPVEAFCSFGDVCVRITQSCPLLQHEALHWSPELNACADRLVSTETLRRGFSY